MKARLLLTGMTGVFLIVHSAVSAPAKYAARINVKGELEKERNSSKDESERSSTKTKSETQYYDLAITAANTGKRGGTFDLEWYFFKRQLDDEGKKGEPVLCEKDKTTLEIGGMKRVLHKVTSEKMTWTESKTSKSSSGNNSSKASSSKNISGSIYGGYIVLLKADGEIVAKYSDEKKFLTPQWLGSLDSTVDSGNSYSNSPKKKKKKKKKK